MHILAYNHIIIICSYYYVITRLCGSYGRLDAVAVPSRLRDRHYRSHTSRRHNTIVIIFIILLYTYAVPSANLLCIIIIESPYNMCACASSTLSPATHYNMGTHARSLNPSLRAVSRFRLIRPITTRSSTTIGTLIILQSISTMKSLLNQAICYDFCLIYYYNYCLFFPSRCYELYSIYRFCG